MYEVTVSVPKCDEHLLAHIKNKTVSDIAEMAGIATDMDSKFRCYFSVACSDTYRFQLKRILVDRVAETMALGYKNIYLRNCLKVGKGNFFQNVLINTMCVFDKTYDKQIIAKILDGDSPMYIDGYCNFRLDMLKRKWQEIANLVSENNYILHDKTLIYEFLQYLLESITHQISHLSVSFEKDGFLMYDSKGNYIPSVESLAPTSSIEEEVAVNVLLLKPKKVSVYYAEKPSADFCKLLELFDSEYIEVV